MHALVHTDSIEPDQFMRFMKDQTEPSIPFLPQKGKSVSLGFCWYVPGQEAVSDFDLSKAGAHAIIPAILWHQVSRFGRGPWVHPLFEAYADRLTWDREGSP